LITLVGFEEMRQVVLNKEVDFVLTNPAAYVELEYSYGITRIATLINQRGNKATKEFGGVIFTRRDRQKIQSLNDIRGWSIMGVHQEAFGGWWMALGELKNIGIDPYSDCREVLFGGKQEAVVFAVRDGKAAVGTVRTGIMERLAQKGEIKLKDFKILGKKNDGFSLPHSTKLYPEWPFAKVKHTPDSLAQKVLIALLGIKVDNKAAVTGNYTGWTIPLDYTSIHTLMKKLRVGPYKEYGEVTFQDIIKKYWYWLALIIVCSSASVLITAFVIRINRRLNISRSKLEQEINERKQAKEALQESQEQLEALFNSVHTGIIIIDAESHRIVDVNPYAVSRIGATADKIAGKVCYEFICPAERGKCPITEQGQTVDNSDRILLDIDGKEIPIIKNVTTLNIGKKRYLLESFIDISDQKQAEEEKKKLETQLVYAQRMESIGTLAGGIAHNFNNLLMGIQGNASIMEFDIDSDHPHYKNLKNIDKLVQNGSQLTSQLLGYARGGKYEVRPINLNLLVKDTADTFGMTRKEIRVHEELSEKLYGIHADQGQIEQVLLNLFVNAADAMPEGGDLFLKTMNVTHEDMIGKVYIPKSGNYTLLTVRDTGTGVDEETMEHIFEPFFTTKGLASGTGLGLASVYGIVKGHGGYIDVDSEKGKGTTFSIYLPGTGETIKDKKELSGEPVKGEGIILLVDDEEIVLDASEHMLRKLGYEVLIATGGREALELCEENQDKIDMVLLDMVMPDMGGGKTYDRMKEINPDIKVLLSSGYIVDGQAQEILDRGCDGFIQKPFNIEQLSQSIRGILDKG